MGTLTPSAPSTRQLNPSQQSGPIELHIWPPGMQTSSRFLGFVQVYRGTHEALKRWWVRITYTFSSKHEAAKSFTTVRSNGTASLASGDTSISTLLESGGHNGSRAHGDEEASESGEGDGGSELHCVLVSRKLSIIEY